MNSIYLLTGSNLGNRFANLNLAARLLEDYSIRILSKSKVYESPAWGYESTNNYLNQVLQVYTSLEPSELMELCLKIEMDCGRLRTGTKIQDRIIDIDILFYRNRIIRLQGLTIPHPRIHQRAFVLVPMNEIDPLFQHPESGLSMKELLAKCPDSSEITVYKGD